MEDEVLRQELELELRDDRRPLMQDVLGRTAERRGADRLFISCRRNRCSMSIRGPRCLQQAATASSSAVPMRRRGVLHIAGACSFNVASLILSVLTKRSHRKGSIEQAHAHHFRPSNTCYAMLWTSTNLDARRIPELPIGAHFPLLV